MRIIAIRLGRAVRLGGIIILVVAAAAAALGGIALGVVLLGRVGFVARICFRGRLIRSVLTGLGSFAFLALYPLAVPLCLTFAVLAFLLIATLVNLALCVGQHAQVMFGVLLEVLCRHAVVAQLGITRQLVVFLDNLLRRAADLAFGARTVENAVNDVATLRLTVAIILGPGP